MFSTVLVHRRSGFAATEWPWLARGRSSWAPSAGLSVSPRVAHSGDSRRVRLSRSSGSRGCAQGSTLAGRPDLPHLSQTRRSAMISIRSPLLQQPRRRSRGRGGGARRGDGRRIVADPRRHLLLGEGHGEALDRCAASDRRPLRRAWSHARCAVLGNAHRLHPPGTTANGVINGTLMGIGIVALGVPLALPIGVLTFFGGYFPIVGSLVSGGWRRSSRSSPRVPRPRSSSSASPSRSTTSRAT